ncbi:MAG TPA: alpha/beta hydrolase [Acidimicrobiia bacterium]|jgi:pimeloyl-ACP methyl ester carboxylesterase
MPLVSISGGSLFAERLGSGPLRVLALHGWGRRGADFAAALGDIGALALDLPGFGASPVPTEAIGAEGYARLIGPAFEMFDEPPVVVGHSFGGRVAVARQFHHPGSAAGLVLTGVPLLRLGERKNPPLGYRLARFANRIGLLSDAAMERERQRRGSADYRAARGVMRDILVKVVNETYERELSGLGVPVHLLWGADDTEVPVRVAEEAEKIITAAGDPVTFEVLEGVGHHVPLKAPEALRKAVEAMLERVGR